MKKQYLLTAIAPLLVGLSGYASSAAVEEIPMMAQSDEVRAASSAINTPALADVLATYVDDGGLVDYEALQANRRQLDAYNASISLTAQSDYDSWSEVEQIAFLINAYNSLTLKAIIDESPIVSSIKDIRGVWRFSRHGLLQDKQTLNNIEHDILRANFTEPRIHVALVCAALSCPYLRQEPYSGENLDAQLDDQMVRFLARPEAFEIDRENGVVKLSAIFDWFGEDWVPVSGTAEGFTGSAAEKAVLNFISGYLEESDQAYLRAGDYSIQYSDYDWSLNQQP